MSNKDSNKDIWEYRFHSVMVGIVRWHDIFHSFTQFNQNKLLGSLSP